VHKALKTTYLFQKRLNAITKKINLLNQKNLKTNLNLMIFCSKNKSFSFRKVWMLVEVLANLQN